MSVLHLNLRKTEVLKNRRLHGKIQQPRLYFSCICSFIVMEDKWLYPLQLDFIEHIHVLVYVFIIITPYTYHMYEP